jgi:predicted  nucleic acid-binding Zn-ribbon protein
MRSIVPLTMVFLLNFVPLPGLAETQPAGEPTFHQIIVIESLTPQQVELIKQIDAKSRAYVDPLRNELGYLKDELQNNPAQAQELQSRIGSLESEIQTHNSNASRAMVAILNQKQLAELNNIQHEKSVVMGIDNSKSSEKLQTPEKEARQRKAARRNSLVKRTGGRMMNRMVRMGIRQAIRGMR